MTVQWTDPKENGPYLAKIDLDKLDRGTMKRFVSRIFGTSGNKAPITFPTGNPADVKARNMLLAEQHDAQTVAQPKTAEAATPVKEHDSLAADPDIAELHANPDADVVAMLNPAPRNEDK